MQCVILVLKESVDMTNTIGSIITKLRKEKGLTQADLASQLNVDSLPSIAEILDVSVE